MQLAILRRVLDVFTGRSFGDVSDRERFQALLWAGLINSLFVLVFLFRKPLFTFLLGL